MCGCEWSRSATIDEQTGSRLTLKRPWSESRMPVCGSWCLNVRLDGVLAINNMPRTCRSPTFTFDAMIKLLCMKWFKSSWKSPLNELSMCDHHVIMS